MYHDTIRIKFSNYQKSSINSSINYEYEFMISKIKYGDKFSPIKYGDLLQKFKNIGFDTKYLKFYDIEDNDTIVYCTYNYQSNFEIFFLAYNKIFKNIQFNIIFEYGNIIAHYPNDDNGTFYRNNMNYFAGISFTPTNLPFGEIIIDGMKHIKNKETYQIIDKDRKTIACETTDISKNFEQHFFEKYEVKVYLRKYKLSRLQNLFN